MEWILSWSGSRKIGLFQRKSFAHRVLDVGLHNNLTWLSFPSVGSPKHKVLDVGLMKRLILLKVLFISPFGEAIEERSGLSLFARFLNH